MVLKTAANFIMESWEIIRIFQEEKMIIFDCADRFMFVLPVQIVQSNRLHHIVMARILN